MILVARPFGTYDGPYAALGPRLWSPLLSQLTHLSITAQQPVQQPYHVPPHHKLRPAKCVDWIQPIVKHFSQSLNLQYIVAVDDDILAAISFPRGFRQVPGDLCFKEGNIPPNLDL